jgi:hypothetical protein
VDDRVVRPEERVPTRPPRVCCAPRLFGCSNSDSELSSSMLARDWGRLLSLLLWRDPCRLLLLVKFEIRPFSSRRFLTIASSSETSSSVPKSTGMTELETKSFLAAAVRLRLPAEEDMPRSTLEWPSSCESSIASPISKISRAFGPLRRLRSFSRGTCIHMSTNNQGKCKI